MKRAAPLLLLLLSAWLLALPAHRLPRAPAPSTSVSAHDGKTQVAEHVVPASVMPHVARAPRLARLPIALQPLPRSGLTFIRLPARRPTCDLRRALRRVQTRRRIPRLGGGEPPWS